MKLTQPSLPTILLDRHAHRYAQQFAKEQANPKKGKQVYLNTLAVYAVHTYIKCFAIKSALHQSDCWHPSLRTMFNIADLLLPKLGKLECRWVLPEDSHVNIPIEVRENRLGYIILQFTEELKQVQLLGFIPGSFIKPTTESIAISEIQPLDSFFDTIDRLQAKVNLSQWFTGIFSQDWQPVEAVMSGRMVRSLSIELSKTSVSRCKIISLYQQQIISVVKATHKSDSEIEIDLQIYPFDIQHNLPANLSVKVLDKFGSSCLEAATQNSDDWIHLAFNCHKHEDFSLEIIWGEIKYFEEFSFS